MVHHGEGNWLFEHVLAPEFSRTSGQKCSYLMKNAFFVKMYRIE